MSKRPEENKREDIKGKKDSMIAKESSKTVSPKTDDASTTKSTSQDSPEIKAAEGKIPANRKPATGREAAKEGFADKSTEQLLEEAQKAGVSGTESMTRQELEQALRNK